MNFCTFSPDGKFVAAAGDGKCICIWDVETGEWVHSLFEHTEAVLLLSSPLFFSLSLLISCFLFLVSLVSLVSRFSFLASLSRFLYRLSRFSSSFSFFLLSRDLHSRYFLIIVADSIVQVPRRSKIDIGGIRRSDFVGFEARQSPRVHIFASLSFRIYFC
jgi:WD40 repeat protein